MSVRPLRLLSAAHLGRIRTLLVRVLEDWEDAWGIERGKLELAVDAASGGPAADWRQHWAGDEGAAWCDWSPDLSGELVKLVFPDDGSHAPGANDAPLAQAGAEAAFDQLLEALRTQCVGSGAPVALLRQPDADGVRHASGYVRVRLALRRAWLRVLLDGECVRRLLDFGAPEPLAKLGSVPLRKALDHIPVALTVKAGEVEIGAGTLLTIGVGDVIALPVPLDGSLSVDLPGGAQLCRGYIGRHGDSLAVEIAKDISE